MHDKRHFAQENIDSRMVSSLNLSQQEVNCERDGFQDHEADLEQEGPPVEHIGTEAGTKTPKGKGRQVEPLTPPATVNNGAPVGSKQRASSVVRTGNFSDYIRTAFSRMEFTHVMQVVQLANISMDVLQRWINHHDDEAGCEIKAAFENTPPSKSKEIRKFLKISVQDFYTWLESCGDEIPSPEQLKGSIISQPRNLFHSYLHECSQRHCRTTKRDKTLPGPLKCLRLGCGAAFKDKASWLKHIRQMCPDQLWKCYKCNTIFGQKDKVLDHFKCTHKCDKRQAAKEKTECETYRVPFYGRCVWCVEYKCRDWMTFWGEHVHDHLVNDPSLSIEAWENAYPPEMPNDSNWSREDMDPNLPSDQSSNDDSDDDDDAPGPSVPRSRRSVDSSRRSNAPRRPGGGRGSGSNGHTGPYQGRQRHACQVSAPSEDEEHSPLQSLNTDVKHQVKDRLEWLKEDKLSFIQNHGPLQGDKAIARQWQPKQSTMRVGQGLSKDVPWHFVRSINQTPESSVDFVRHSLTGVSYLRKTALIFSDYTSLQARFIDEVEILKKVKDPHILSLSDFYMDNFSYNLIFAAEPASTLSDVLEHPNDGCWKHGSTWFGCLSWAMEYLHSGNITHGDIKPTNVLVFGSSVKLSHFSLSPDPPRYIHTSCMTAAQQFYSAPEVLETGKPGKAADVYSLGFIFLEMMTVLVGMSLSRLHNWVSSFEDDVKVRRSDHMRRTFLLRVWLRLLCSAPKRSKVHEHLLSHACHITTSMVAYDWRRRPDALKVLKSIGHPIHCCQTPTSIKSVQPFEKNFGYSFGDTIAMYDMQMKANLMWAYQQATLLLRLYSRTNEGSQLQMSNATMRGPHISQILRKPRRHASRRTISESLLHCGAHVDLSMPSDPPQGGPSDIDLYPSIPHKSALNTLFNSDSQSKQSGRLDTSFYIFGTEVNFVHTATDFKTHESKWHGWSDLLHNVEWPQEFGSLDFLFHSISRRVVKHENSLMGSSNFCAGPDIVTQIELPAGPPSLDGHIGSTGCKKRTESVWVVVKIVMIFVFRHGPIGHT